MQTRKDKIQLALNDLDRKKIENNRKTIKVICIDHSVL